MKFMIIDNSDITFLECEPEEAVLQVKKRIREDFCDGKPISRIEIIRSNLNLSLGVYGEFSAVVYFTDGSIKGFQVLPDPNFHADRVYKENTPPLVKTSMTSLLRPMQFDLLDQYGMMQSLTMGNFSIVFSKCQILFLKILMIGQ